MKNSLMALICAVGLAACAPSDGPSASNIVNKAKRDDIPVLQMNENVLQTLGGPRTDRGLASLRAGSYTPGVIKPGDTISVTLFDTGESGMFEVGSSGSLPLGEYTVSEGGTVDLPFAGGLSIGGRSASAAQSIITRKLREKLRQSVGQRQYRAQGVRQFQRSGEGAGGGGGAFKRLACSR